MHIKYKTAQFSDCKNNKFLVVIANVIHYACIKALLGLVTIKIRILMVQLSIFYGWNQILINTTKRAKTLPITVIVSPMKKMKGSATT